MEILYLPLFYPKNKSLLKLFSDISIIEGVRKQDEKILNWLYENYFPSVSSYVIRNSGSSEDVSDVFQDTIIILYKQISENNIKLTTDLKGYFFGIARNVWNSHLRKRQKTLELDTDIADDEDYDPLNSNVLEKVLSRAFQKLKPDQQEILNLFSEGYSYQDIAVKMNLKNEVYARRKKYLSKEYLLELVKEDPEYQEYFRLRE